MQMRKLGIAGQPEQAESLAGGDRVAGPDRDAAQAQMGVLGLPAVAVVDDDAVAGFAAGDRRPAGRRGADVGHAVAHP